MGLVKKILRGVAYILGLLMLYSGIAILLSSITVDRKETSEILEQQIYLHTNGVHLDIAIPIEAIDTLVLSGLRYDKNEAYLSFGWGDENFYINTPTWGDLTFSNGFKALFLKSSTLIHLTPYKQKQVGWVPIAISVFELQNLNKYLYNAFVLDGNGMKMPLKDKGYFATDTFYKSKGSYSCFKTCNSWVNTGFKESGLKACLWTPFDFALLNKYN